MWLRMRLGHCLHRKIEHLTNQNVFMTISVDVTAVSKLAGWGGYLLWLLYNFQLDVFRLNRGLGASNPWEHDFQLGWILFFVWEKKKGVGSSFLCSYSSNDTAPKQGPGIVQYFRWVSSFSSSTRPKSLKICNPECLLFIPHFYSLA
ncbi:hypothetical protein NC651_021083 [Populus alba x Populus x berolinensis]|nr:hypothetical protein NC651_021083 [Populus alba x Populus x berolinensis]